ncbi:MAG: uridine kinase, partial [Pedobacter sp.]
LYNFDLPSTIDDEQFLIDIKKLIKGDVVYKKEYNFNNPLAVVKILEINPAPILIVEGLFILHFQQIAELLDLRIFIEADEYVALQRRIKRDGMERGYPEDDVMYKWENHVVPAYKEFLLPYKESCNKIVINNNDTPDDIIRITEEITEELKAKFCK